jgi:hypothetical protein
MIDRQALSREDRRIQAFIRRQGKKANLLKPQPQQKQQQTFPLTL